ncbi:MAG: putative colanic acid biosynthesis acetyltransferase [Chloroflexota bacterium]|nr:putative colanic acid biosynthesis acetyltransferase [Chloroflexota bacterium]
MTLDIDAARTARPYSTSEYLGRVLWAFATPLFRLSPRPCYRWRRVLLRCFGASVGREVRIHPSARIVIPWNLTIGDQASLGDRVLVYNLGRVHIGPRATVSHLAHLCAGSHDYLDPRLPLLRLPIDIGADAWVCAQGFIGPGLKVGAGAVVAAGAVVTRSVDPWTVVAGNPAKPIKQRVMRPDGPR